ncbi:MAG: PAS domain S-box protein [Sphingobacteriaceae bacterium]|nr:PAS domain S-box protein [Sphingobacteriaceae bacterium]
MEFYNAAEFFNLSKDLFCVIGADGYLRKVNDAFQRSLGYSAETLLSNPISHFLHNDDLPEFSGYYKAASPGAITSRFKCADGSYKWLLWNCTIVPGQSYIYASVRDITSQKSLEQHLTRALQSNQRILDSSLDLICTFDTEGNFVSVSKASENLLGYSCDEMSGKSCGMFLHPSDAEITSKMAADLLNGAELTNFENRYIHKNGSIVTVVWSGKWIAEDQLFYCVGRNAAERKKQEDEIKFNEKRFKELVQTGADVIAILNSDGICQFTSETISNVLGYDPQHWIGKNISEFIHPQYYEIFNIALKRVSQQFKVELPAFKLKNSKGEWRWIETVLTNLINEDTIKGIVANSRDVTEQFLIENQKEKAIRRLNKLIENYTQGYFSLDKNWIIREVNPATLRLLDMPREKLINRSLLELFPSHQANFSSQYRIAVRENRFVEFEEKMSSTNRWFQIAAYPYEEGLTVFFKEVTNEKLQQLLVNLEKEVLEYHIGAERTLSNTVTSYLSGLTDIYNFKCLLSLFNKNTALLMPFSAPALPDEYLNLLTNGFPVSQEMGSCGAAAFTGECYVVRDISSHPNYDPFKDVLLKNELLSCWSLPLISAGGKLLGTLAVYHNTIKVPDEYERNLIKRVAAFLQVLIESHQVKERLIISNERYKYITIATNDAVYDWNMINEYLYWGEGAQKLFGYKEKKSKLSDWEKRIHPAERAFISKSLEMALKDPDVTYWHEEYRYKKADGSYAFVIEDGCIIRDEQKKPIRMVGALKDITKLQENANQILKQNKRLQEIATINSHHIRKPLANVLGIINALNYADNKQTAELLAMLEESGSELDRIVRKIAKKTLV